MIRRSGRVLAVLAVAVTLVVATPGPAVAHNGLRFADPADTASLAAAPRQVTLVFSERLDPQFTTVAVTDAAGTAMTSGPVQVSDTTAVQPLLPTLGAGSFTVAYRVVSVDGHPVAGSLKFTVTLVEEPAQSNTASTAPSATPPATEATPAATPVSRTDADDSRGTGLILVTVAVIAVLVGLGAVIVRIRRRPPRSQ